MAFNQPNTQARTYPNINTTKGQIAQTSGNIEEITAFYNEFTYKIKASNIFPQMEHGSSTGRYTMVVFYDK